MLDFSEILHVARGFLNQYDCRTFENSMLMKQAILNMYLDIIMWLDILTANKLIKCFCLFSYGQIYPILSQPIGFQDP